MPHPCNDPRPLHPSVTRTVIDERDRTRESGSAHRRFPRSTRIRTALSLHGDRKPPVVVMRPIVEVTAATTTPESTQGHQVALQLNLLSEYDDRTLTAGWLLRLLAAELVRLIRGWPPVCLSVRPSGWLAGWVAELSAQINLHCDAETSQYGVQVASVSGAVDAVQTVDIITLRLIRRDVWKCMSLICSCAVPGTNNRKHQ